jgi:hypothetical protein
MLCTHISAAGHYYTLRRPSDVYAVHRQFRLLEPQHAREAPGARVCCTPGERLSSTCQRLLGEQGQLDQPADARKLLNQGRKRANASE